jgi:hypothetical protein
MNVTRSVILDLWPLYTSSEASDDTRALVDAFLAGDPEFARELTAAAGLPIVSPALPPDAEVQAFTRLRRRLRGYPFLLTLALVFSGSAFGRLISDTSFDVSPRQFIATAAIAVAFWTAYLVSLWRMRARIIILPAKAPRT